MSRKQNMGQWMYMHTHHTVDMPKTAALESKTRKDISVTTYASASVQVQIQGTNAILTIYIKTMREEATNVCIMYSRFSLKFACRNVLCNKFRCYATQSMDAHKCK